MVCWHNTPEFADSDQERSRQVERAEALKLVMGKVKNRNLVKHMLATEAAMRALAGFFNEDRDRWGLAGLIHDIDLGEGTPPERHGRRAVEILHEAGFNDEEICEAIEAHPGVSPRKTKLAKALYAADPLTGLIVAAALIRPEKRIDAIDTAFVLNRFKEKHFARGAKREQIAACSELGITLEDFVGIGLEAMKGIAADLGL